MDNLKVIGDRWNSLQLRIETVANELKKRIVVKREAIDGIKYMECGYKDGTVMPDINMMREFGVNERWGGKVDAHAWFYKKINFPKSNYRVELSVETQRDGWDASNPQFMLYIDGKLKQGMDVNHRSATITESGEHDVFLYAYTGTDVTELLDLFVSINLIDEELEKLYYNLFVPSEVLKYTPLGSKEYNEILLALTEALNILYTRDLTSEEFRKSVRSANEYLQKEFYEKICKETEERVALFGHTHIDVAWKWTVAQTIEKTQRSFATVDALMERYPEYRFMSSQVPLYKAVKEQCPELYERIKKRVKEGRWEVEGGMYLESDCNLTNGESLVRQFLYGKKFFEREFGVDSKVLWLPDVFGYSAALPQILRKCGINDFVTSKISWNDANTMPYDLFKWRGIDGSEVTTHYITSQDYDGSEPSRYCTYVCTARPSLIKGTYERYQQKLINGETMSTIGYGDGGGGTTPNDCELVRRQSYGIPNQPTAKWRSVKEYIASVNEKVEKSGRIPVWQGELYLERHRGTLTSQGKNKASNRRSEFLLQNAESVSVIGSTFGESVFDKQAHDEIWELVLLNQFHDILPGSSIKEVYEQTDVEYAKIAEYGKGVIYDTLNALAKKVKGSGVLVYNPNSFEYSGVIEVDGKKVLVENIPQKGYAVVKPKKVKCKGTYTAKTLENEFYKVVFDDKMNIVSLVDKKACNRELIKTNESIRFIAYEDFSSKGHDAWEINLYYTEKKYEVDEVVSVTPLMEDDRVGVEVVRKFDNSIITDRVYLYDNEKRIEFDDSVDWHSKHILLKRYFPVDIVTDKATCEIQFGYAERPTHKNTSWDWAKYEVCAQKYVDMSEGDYGVTLINDCKYGYNVSDGGISISLLRGPEFPDADCDMGQHSFKYALLSHEGSLVQSNVIQKAYEFNNPCYAVVATGGSGEIPDAFSSVTALNGKLVVDTVKPSEDGSSVVVRAYEPYRTRGTEILKVGVKAKKAYLCDMLENELEELKIENGQIKVDFKPFEIITIKLV